MEGKQCLFQRNGRLEKGIIKRVDPKSSRVVVSFYDGKCGRALDLNEILMIEQVEVKKNKKKLWMTLFVLLLFALTAFGIHQYFSHKVICLYTLKKHHYSYLFINF
jgi:hypothetical protein